MSEKTESIRERESWLKIGVIIFLCLIIGIPIFWELITSRISFELTNANIGLILSLVISFFAIFLSVLFYLKATESSNMFYNNTYTFTKDISETLRGIEAGFGEKLSHIDRGYEDFRRIYEQNISPSEKKEIRKEVEEEKRNLDKIIKEKNNIIEELNDKSKLSKEDIYYYLNKIRSIENELVNKNKQLNIFKEKLRDNDNYLYENTFDKIKKYTKLVVLPKLDKRIISSSELLRLYFKNMIPRFDPRFIKDLERTGYIDDNGNLSFSGVELIRKINRDLIGDKSNKF